MFPFTNVLNFLANKLACLRARRLPFTFVLTCSFERLFFRHLTSSPLCSLALHENKTNRGVHVPQTHMPLSAPKLFHYRKQCVYLSANVLEPDLRVISRRRTMS